MEGVFRFAFFIFFRFADVSFLFFGSYLDRNGAPSIPHRLWLEKDGKVLKKALRALRVAYATFFKTFLRR